MAAFPSISTVDSFSGIKTREKRLLPDRFWAEALSIKNPLRTNGNRPEAENGPTGSTRIHPDKSLFTAFPSQLAERNILTISQIQIPMSDRSSTQEIIEDRQPDAKSPIFSSHFLVNSSPKNGLFRCLWFVKIRQALPSKNNPPSGKPLDWWDLGLKTPVREGFEPSVPF